MKHRLNKNIFKYFLGFNLSGELELEIIMENENGENKEIVLQGFASGFFNNYRENQTVDALIKDISLFLTVFYLATKFNTINNKENKYLTQLKKIQKDFNANNNEFIVFIDNCLDFGKNIANNTTSDVFNEYLKYIYNSTNQSQNLDF
jgi:hypothetical protein